MLKADFHIHTEYSMDCQTSLDDLISRCLELGINCITVSDHDAVDGAKQLQRIAPFTVIVAEEILTPQGEIMGMFLQERIPSGVSVEQAISRIKEQGGLVCLPHPFDTLRGLKLEGKEIEKLVGRIDIIEAFNARSLFNRCNTKARAFAMKHDIPMTAGSDAHSPAEMGGTYVEMPEFEEKQGFLQSLRQGVMHKKKSSFLVHINSTMARLKKSK
ncbi:MAG: PHP domain-containing protein [Chloroflexi bacterium]|nr:PHP domain-containing protein [Chloroflexota bacterium]